MPQMQRDNVDNNIVENTISDNESVSHAPDNVNDTVPNDIDYEPDELNYSGNDDDYDQRSDVLRAYRLIVFSNICYIVLREFFIL